jgi:hypothetical protein
VGLNGRRRCVVSVIDGGEGVGELASPGRVARRREGGGGRCFSRTSEVQFETEAQSKLVQFVGHRGKRGLS